MSLLRENQSSESTKRVPTVRLIARLPSHTAFICLTSAPQIHKTIQFNHFAPLLSPLLSSLRFSSFLSPSLPSYILWCMLNEFWSEHIHKCCSRKGTVRPSTNYPSIKEQREDRGEKEGKGDKGERREIFKHSCLLRDTRCSHLTSVSPSSCIVKAPVSPSCFRLSKNSYNFCLDHERKRELMLALLPPFLLLPRFVLLPVYYFVCFLCATNH